ncbi:Hypothetical predicted protein, partial [Paramuricea clavata]
DVLCVDHTDHKMKSFIIQRIESRHCLFQVKVCSQQAMRVETAACRIGHQMKTFIMQEPRDFLCHLEILASDQVREHSLN